MDVVSVAYPPWRSMTDGSEHYPSGDATGSARPASVYERVMSNPVSRDAYFHTAQCVLHAPRNHPDLQEIRDALAREAVAYVFNEDSHMPDPAFCMENSVTVGVEAITARIAALATQPR